MILEGTDAVLEPSNDNPQLLRYVVSNMRKWLWPVPAFVRGKPWKYQTGYPTNPFGFTCVCVPEITFNWYVAGPGRRLQHGDSADGPHWTCTQCTFQNHPLLDKCETCEMPRLLLGTDTCYCHPTPTKLSPTQPTGSACGETTSSWAVVNCGVINRMMWLTEQRCKYTITFYLVCYWHSD